MPEFEQKIGKVRSSFIGFEGHGLLSVSLDFDYGGSVQGLAHRAFGSMNEQKDPEAWRHGHAAGMDFIRRLMLALNVDRWDQIVGRTAFVTCSWTTITKIEPLPTEGGEPFYIEEWAASLERVTA